MLPRQRRRRCRRSCRRRRGSRCGNPVVAGPPAPPSTPNVDPVGTTRGNWSRSMPAAASAGDQPRRHHVVAGLEGVRLVGGDVAGRGRVEQARIDEIRLMQKACGSHADGRRMRAQPKNFRRRIGCVERRGTLLAPRGRSLRCCASAVARPSLYIRPGPNGRNAGVDRNDGAGSGVDADRGDARRVAAAGRQRSWWRRARRPPPHCHQSEASCSRPAPTARGAGSAANACATTLPRVSSTSARAPEVPMSMPTTKDECAMIAARARSRAPAASRRANRRDLRRLLDQFGDVFGGEQRAAHADGAVVGHQRRAQFGIAEFGDDLLGPLRAAVRRRRYQRNSFQLGARVDRRQRHLAPRRRPCRWPTANAGGRCRRRRRAPGRWRDGSPCPSTAWCDP